jgi:hypothetical protein
MYAKVYQGLLREHCQESVHFLPNYFSLVIGIEIFKFNNVFYKKKYFIGYHLLFAATQSSRINAQFAPHHVIYVQLAEGKIGLVYFVSLFTHKIKVTLIFTLLCIPGERHADLASMPFPKHSDSAMCLKQNRHRPLFSRVLSLATGLRPLRSAHLDVGATS